MFLGRSVANLTSYCIVTLRGIKLKGWFYSSSRESMIFLGMWVLMMRGGITVRRGINITPFMILPEMTLVFNRDLLRCEIFRCISTI
jgi:hypothetical protein